MYMYTYMYPITFPYLVAYTVLHPHFRSGKYHMGFSENRPFPRLDGLSHWPFCGGKPKFPTPSLLQAPMALSPSLQHLRLHSATGCQATGQSPPALIFWVVMMSQSSKCQVVEIHIATISISIVTGKIQLVVKHAYTHIHSIT